MLNTFSETGCSQYYLVIFILNRRVALQMNVRVYGMYTKAAHTNPRKLIHHELYPYQANRWLCALTATCVFTK